MQIANRERVADVSAARFPYAMAFVFAGMKVA